MQISPMQQRSTPAVTGPQVRGAAPPPVDTDAFVGSAELAAQAFMEQPAAAQVGASSDPDRAAKESVIRGMVRRSPDEAVTKRLVEVLSAYPLPALEAVSAYGTRIEAYDFKAGEAVPEYQPTLGTEGVVGAYNTRANVLGFDRHNADTFVILHEFAHALDAALNEPSASAEWKNAHYQAANTNQIVRDYAKYDVSEYLAENTCAYLVADASMPDLIDRGLAEGAMGLGDREYMQLVQNLSNGRLHAVDPQGWALVDNLLHKQAAEGLRRAPLPAMTEAQWAAAMAKAEPQR